MCFAQFRQLVSQIQQGMIGLAVVTEGTRHIRITIEQAQMHLLHTPGIPPASATYLFAHHLNENQDWMPFITGW